MIVVDTSVWIDYVNGVVTPQTNILDIELESSRLATGDLIIVEFLQGFREDSQSMEAKDLMDSLEYYDFEGKEVAINAAQNLRRLTQLFANHYQTPLFPAFFNF